MQGNSNTWRERTRIRGEFSLHVNISSSEDGSAQHEPQMVSPLLTIHPSLLNSLQPPPRPSGLRPLPLPSLFRRAVAGWWTSAWISGEASFHAPKTQDYSGGKLASFLATGPPLPQAQVTFAKKCPSLHAQKWHFGCRNSLSLTNWHGFHKS